LSPEQAVVPASSRLTSMAANRFRPAPRSPRPGRS
jgi:hypothetical protein